MNRYSILLATLLSLPMGAAAQPSSEVRLPSYRSLINYQMNRLNPRLPAFCLYQRQQPPQLIAKMEKVP